MTIGIYCIEHIASGRKYVGKSVNIERRLATHRYALTREVRSKDTNRHLWNCVQKYGWDQFKTYVLQSFDEIDEELIGLSELEWMDKFNSCDRDFGFNLRRDTSTKMITHPETLIALSVAHKRRYNDEDFGDYERKMNGIRSKRSWAKMLPETKAKMGRKIAALKRKYHYAQCDMFGRIVCIWRSLDELKVHYPEANLQNIHSVCDGHKASYMGFVWEKLDPNKSDPGLLYSGEAPCIEWGVRFHPPQWWVDCIDPDEGLVETFMSVAEAAKAHGVSYGYMSNCLQGRVKTINGYEFRKTEPIYVSLQNERKISKKRIFEEDDL